MGECKIDHSHDDVRKKFEDQAAYLPLQMNQLFEQFFSKEHTQGILNEVFHLLKKFDLASEEEKQERTNRLYIVLKNV